MYSFIDVSIYIFERTKQMKDFIQIHPDDNVAVALHPLAGGAAAGDITLAGDIPQGHKFALCPIAAGAPVIKYGAPIGRAVREISAGAWVHTHNLKTGLGGLLTYTYEPQAAACTPLEDAFFQGFRRPDGKAGIRNDLWIIPTVGCVNNVAQRLEQKAAHLAQGTIGRVTAFPHPYGCSQTDEDQENTRRILADFISHPNAGGVLVLGLGCENSNIEILKNYIDPRCFEHVRFLNAQDTDDELTDGLTALEDLAGYAGQFRREPISVRELVVGLKCGGSDGLSGITANPTVGVFSDLLTARGGTTILTEVPEMFGAETFLMNRCRTKELFDQTVRLINDFKNYFTSYGQTIYENPSPGNKAGGISTLEDKSLGCIQKSGSSPVCGVLSYGEQVHGHGLHLLSAPGNDLVASTALAASGAQLVLFTTGRGTPFAAPVPTVKIATNTQLYQMKRTWIDFNCGTVTDGETVPEAGARLFDYVLEVASGEQVCSERAGYHDMAIFKQGVTL